MTLDALLSYLTPLSVLLAAACAIALYGLGYVEGMRHDRRRIARMIASCPDSFDDETDPMVDVPRPQFHSPVIDVEEMRRIEAQIPRLDEWRARKAGRLH